MGYHFKIFLVLIIFIIISFHCSHLLTLNAEKYLNNGQNPNDLYFMESSRSLRYIEKVSGEEKSEAKKCHFLEKFRFLLGLNGLHKDKNGHEFGSFSPSPSPSPAPSIVEASAPSPTLPWIHSHTHPPKQHHHLMPEAHKEGKKDIGKVSKIIAVGVVSATVFFLLCSALIFWGCQRFNKQKTKKSGVKRSSDTFGVSLEIQESDDIVRRKNQNEREDQGEAVENQESGNFDAIGEIVCVHEAKNHHIVSVEKVQTSEILDNHDDDDDESFHSFSDYSQNAEISSPKMSFQEFDCVTNQESHFQSEHPTIPQPPPPPSTFPSFRSRKVVSKTLDSPSKTASNHTTQCSSPSSVPNAPTPSGGGGGAIPPPGPPPFPNGKPYSAKVTPPPPPPQTSQNPALGRDGSPLTKLKPLHWDKVRAASDRSTVWDKLRSSSFEFDEETIKSLFGCNLQNTIKNDELKIKTPSPKKHVLELKRLQNITILTKALSMTSEQVCDALIKGNGLALQELEALAKMVPTKEEEAKFSNYKGNVDELGSADQFIKTMVKIPFAFSRIEAMLYKETFDDEIVHLRKSFSVLEEACKELRSSRLFLKLLEAVLKTGNRMNIGTIRGGARAFKLDTLLKLSDVKATDGKTTLLHFVVQEIVRSEGFRVSESIMGKINQKTNKKSGNIQDKEDEYKNMGLELVSSLGVELRNVKKTATLDLDVLATSVSNLSQGLRKMHRLVYNDICVEEKDGDFVHRFRTFITYAERNLKELQEDENRVLLQVREITEYFHGDVSKEESNLLRIFVIVRDFLCMLDHVCKELRSLKTSTTSNPLAPFR